MTETTTDVLVAAYPAVEEATTDCDAVAGRVSA
jgi:hypothetical protein